MKKRVDNKGRKLKNGESQRKDGMYQFRYTDQAGDRKTLYSWKLTTLDRVPDGKKDGKCLRELELEIEKDRKSVFVGKTVSQCIREYLSMRTDYAVNTKMGYEMCLRVYIDSSFLGNMILAEVTRSNILQFYAYLAQERNLGFSAIKENHSILNSVFKIAIKDGIIVKNPCTGCLLEYRTKTPEKVVLSKQEQHVLLEFLKDDSNCYSRHYGVIAFLLGSGLRVSEFVGLTWDEIDLEMQCINLRHQIVFEIKGGKKLPTISSLKNGKPRIVPLPTKLVSILQKQLEKQSSLVGPVVDGVSGFIFLNRNHKIYQPGDLDAIFRRIVKQFNEDNESLKLPPITAHTFRHTYCTRIIELGVDLKVVQEIMGHSTAKVTLEVYTHLSKEQLNSEIHRVRKIDLGD